MRKGISLVALVITIIVLVILVGAVIITGVNSPKGAQLAVFYNNVTNVQDAVTLKIMENVTKNAEKKDIELYKWIEVVNGYTEEMAIAKTQPTFTAKEINGIQTAKLDAVLKESMKISEEEFNKYYVDNKGVVYHEGFIYEGNTYYNRNSNIGTEQIPTTQYPIDGTYCERKGVNSPRLASGMTAVYWDVEGKEVTSNNPGNDPNFDYNLWYDYKAQTTNTESGGTSKWANAKTSDGSYWVWIPRYGYSITSGYHTNIAGTIEVEFLKDKTNTSTSGRTTWDNASGQENWNVHPGFYYDGDSTTGTQLSGFWVAKYEMSSEGGKAVSKPGVTSWREISRSDAFTNALNYDTTSVSNANLDSHLMKNMEWGAVAYLTHSKYGRNSTRIAINNNGFYTGGVSGATAHTNLLQSTTGNCYGVYDIGGGADEQVAAYLNGTVTNNMYGSTLVNADDKYKEVYDVGTTTDYGKINEIRVYGDARYETSSIGERMHSWHDNYSFLLNASDCFMQRGGVYNREIISGVFAFVASAGEPNEYYSWRVVFWNN